jgi:MFS transporter, ACS family, tartrate transporter
LPDCIRPPIAKRFLKGGDPDYVNRTADHEEGLPAPAAVLLCLYFICYLDRVNIGFAALTMNKDLGLSSYVFGLGAGAFFWGYFILEVPSNLILDRVGARGWIARIMVTWGLVSGAFSLINGPVSFFTLRFLLGLA